MEKFYKVLQGDTVNGHWVTPQFPINDENIALNLANGVAFEIDEQHAQFAPWGSGNWVKHDDGSYENVAWNFDSSD